jgi:hypothetical protein
MAARATQAQPFSFDDIDFWVGSGANRAAMAIDWVEGSTERPALAWGYRWDGEARGRDMLVAIVTADPRLFGKFGGTATSPNAVYGLGYDFDDDGQFAIDDDTTFNSEGIAISGPADGAVSTDSDDYYAEGWFGGFWHYGIASTNPYDGGTWSDIQFGMAARVLTDGAWDSWTFELSTVPPFDAYAENPAAAEPPGDPPGDLDRDGNVDLDDYDEWRRTFGTTGDAAADANGDGGVGAADYTVWRKFFSSPAGSGSVLDATTTVPEPNACWLAVGSLLSLTATSLRKRKGR